MLVRRRRRGWSSALCRTGRRPGRRLLGSCGGAPAAGAGVTRPPCRPSSAARGCRARDGGAARLTTAAAAAQAVASGSLALAQPCKAGGSRARGLRHALPPPPGLWGQHLRQQLEPRQPQPQPQQPQLRCSCSGANSRPAPRAPPGHPLPGWLRALSGCSCHCCWGGCSCTGAQRAQRAEQQQQQPVGGTTALL